MSNYLKHAEREFKAAGWLNESGEFNDDMQKLLCEGVKDLLEVFAEAGHSGSSAPYALRLFSKLAAFEPIVPLTGEAWEWVEAADGVWQNSRCSHVFKQADRFDGQAYDINAVVFFTWEGEGEDRWKSCYTSSDSFRAITFPYMPVTVYEEVIEE